MKHLICLSLLLPALLKHDSSSGKSQGEKEFCHQSSCCLEQHPTILTISCKNKAWQLQCSEDSEHLNMSFRLKCSDKDRKIFNFQLTSTSTEICLKMNCEGYHITKTCDNQISISSLRNSSYKINLRGSDCEFVTQRADNQTGMFPMPKTWIEALQFCRILNSTLVEITNQTVQNAVTTILKDKPGLQNGFWVGLDRSIFGINPEWMWISRNKTIQPDWNSSNSVDPLNNHCGKVVLVGNQVKLVDENCHQSLPFICHDKLGKI